MGPGGSVSSETHQLLQLYPAVVGVGQAELAGLLESQSLLHLPVGTQVFSERQPCMGFPLLLSGSIKVVKTTSSGREMLLYRVEPGGSCIITSSCLLGHTDYSARGVAETDLSLLLLPNRLFQKWVAESAVFRDFVFHLLSERIAELMQLVEEVAFARLDQRLAKLLLAKAGDRNGETLYTTHQQLAEELGSVREIVSRLLKGFAAQGLVSLGREQLTLLDRSGLARLAGGSV